MLVTLNKLKTSLMNCSFWRSVNIQVRVTRISNELKSRPKCRLGSTCESVRRPGFVVDDGGGPLALQGNGEGTAAVQVGREFHTSMREIGRASCRERV